MSDDKQPPAADDASDPGRATTSAAAIDVPSVTAAVPVERKSVLPVAAPAKSSQSRVEVDDDDDDDEDDEEDDIDDDEDHDGPVNYSAAEAAGAFSSVFAFTRPYLSAHRSGIVLVGLGLLVEMAFNVSMPLVLKYLIDEVFEEKNYSQLLLVLAVLGVAGLVTSVVAIWYEWQDAKVTSAIAADVRRNLFAHIQKLPVSFYNRSRKGEVLSRFSNDMTTYEEAVINLANWGVLPLLELIAGIVLLMVLNPQLGLLALLIFPLVLIVPRIVTPRAVLASYEVKRAQAGELGVVQENVGAQAVVKAFGLQGLSLRWFTQRNQMLRAAQQRSTFLNTIVERSITIAVLWLHLLVLAVGAYLTFNDVITIGTFVAFESVFWEITYNLNHLTQYIPVVIDAAGAVRHMNQILDEPIRVSDKPDAVEAPRITTQIAFERVSFSYDGVRRQLDRLDLVIPAGRRVAIVGPSGAGKSTLLSLLLRFYDTRQGRVTIDGVDIADVTRDSLRAQMAIVFQENVLFNTTFRENIRLGSLDASDAQVEAAARQAEIHKFIAAQPQGYETMVGERGDTLSGGQRQRIAIARALVRDPAILLLDEATSALDQTTEAAVNRTLKKIGKGRTLLFVTHRLTSVIDMDEIVVLDAGRLVQRGTHSELLKKRGGLYRRLWTDQMRESAEEDED
ncbi:ABC transporter ATP-binding protein [Bosea sp. PAMC 26642]|uniref:ABC transporter ATP-binding protein n=1 Tax=Bosea sp. (strain PAMC 26642) TaxID=1792307 RepID=UPI0012E7CE4B|nr:ABC transporter ATP-binding protein [Bosea sp. PAMC 26642]